uniref:Uncharacterized protein n=1 Tax=Pseudomonas phage HRDY3 TaxID=3236930 RepID=A0AB39CDK0_9VIRU
MKPPSNLSQKNPSGNALDLPNALGSDPIFCEFLNNGYEWIRLYPEDLYALKDGDYPFQLRKRFYKTVTPDYHERAYIVYVRVSNLYRIEGYPKDGSMPRFLFRAQVEFQNVDPGIPIGVLHSEWRVMSVDEAEKPAHWLWQQLGEPEQ